MTTCQTATVRGVAELMRLAGRTELAEMLGISRQRARLLTERSDFPEPVARMRRGPIWRIEDLEAWARKVGRTLTDLPPWESD
jgi:prophage regulatory protein